MSVVRLARIFPWSSTVSVTLLSLSRPDRFSRILPVLEKALNAPMTAAMKSIAAEIAKAVPTNLVGIGNFGARALLDLSLISWRMASEMLAECGSSL